MANEQQEFPGFASKKPRRKAETEESAIQELLIPSKSIQVAAAGSVLVTALEREIIDTPAFQRLRRIKQLGAAFTVYPTAVHSRFDHSLGTLQVASDMVRAIRENTHSDHEERTITPEQELIVRLYALLHDITHVPFGHTIEDELRLLNRHDKNEKRIQFFLGPESAIGTIINKAVSKELFDIFQSVYRHDPDATNPTLDPSWHFVHELVSNTVCADLLDYLRRDDYFCDLGISMRYRFLNFLYVSKGSPRHLVIRLYKRSNIPRRDTLSDLCRLLESRYMIAERVYFHHAKLAAGTMLGVAIQAHASVLTAAGQSLEDEIRLLGDEELIVALTGSPSSAAKEVAQAFRERRLYKTLHIVTKDEVSAARSLQGESHRNLKESLDNLTNNPDERAKVVQKYAALIGCEPHHLAIYVPPEEMGTKDAEMKVHWDGSLKALKDISDEHVKPRLKAVEEAHKRLWSIALIGHADLRGGRPADWFARLFRADYIAASDAEAGEMTNAVLREVAEQALLTMPGLPDILPAKIPKLLDEMVGAASSPYKEGSGDVRAAMSERARGFLQEG